MLNNMLINFNDGQPIDLAQMLLAKEKRVENQKLMLNRYNYPLISLSIVIPGPIKNSSGANFLFKEAIKALHDGFTENALLVIDEQHYHSIAGAEAIMSVKCSVNKLKQYCINIEENHPLGRLWDIDVIDPITQQSLSRYEFEHHARQCLVCQDMAKVCSRARRHSLDDIFSAMEKKINDYLINTPV